MQKIIPHLWFDKEAKAAAEFYTSVFVNSKINSLNTIPDTPSGDAELVGFQIMGYEFMAISAGPFFKINPSISFHIRCRAVEEVNQIWENISAGGTVMMELGEYPFSKRYGWIQDKFGVSWQVIQTEGEFTQRIMPALMFVGDVCGKAEEAIGFYASVFQNTKSEVLARYEKGEEPDREGTVKYAQFTLEGQEFGAIESAWTHNFGFNEGVSFIVNCSNQKEIDYLWEKLSAVPEAEQCGWIKDKYGVSWQIVPANMGELIGKNPEKTTPAMLKMKKIIIANLEQAGAER
ncbi:VOC family protein [candidate division KSB1 bacterium]|nr:VOC family protein [candidate division KSB1 bacterium]